MNLNALWIAKLTILIFDVVMITNSDSHFDIEQRCDALGGVTLWSNMSPHLLSTFCKLQNEFRELQLLRKAPCDATPAESSISCCNKSHLESAVSKLKNKGVKSSAYIQVC